MQYFMPIKFHSTEPPGHQLPPKNGLGGALCKGFGGCCGLL